MGGRASDVVLAEGLDVPLQAFDEVPMIDFAGFLDGSDKEGVARQVGEAARDVGFLYVRNHGVAEDLRRGLFESARAFFALPAEEKQQLYRSEATSFRGYRGPFGQNYEPDKQLSYNENFFVWTQPPAGHHLADPSIPLYGPNIWPEGLPGFRPAVQAYLDAVYLFSRRLMRAFALALGLAEDFFEPMLDAPLGTLSLNRYPPHRGRIGHEVLGISEHSDYGLATVLAQDEVPGLQVKNAEGRWIGVPPVPGAYVINLGQQMERLTNGLFKATAHRVINVSGGERFSVPFFVEPNWDAKIAVLPSCQDARHPPRYEPAQVGPYYLAILRRSHSPLSERMRAHAEATVAAG